MNVETWAAVAYVLRLAAAIAAFPLCFARYGECRPRGRLLFADRR